LKKRKRKEPSPLGEILGRYLDQAGLRTRVREQKLLEGWGQLVGQSIADVTQPVRVRNQALHVTVTHPVWMQQLQFHKRLIIQKANEFLGGPFLKEVRFVLGEREEIHLPKSAREGRILPRELRGEERERIASAVDAIHDPEMREALSRLFARGLTVERKLSPK